MLPTNITYLSTETKPKSTPPDLGSGAVSVPLFSQPACGPYRSLAADQITPVPRVGRAASLWTTRAKRVKSRQMSTITLQLPDNLALELAQAGKETNRTPEAVAEEMLRRMIALQRFDRLRTEVRQVADNSSPLSEDDILNEIS